MPTLLTLKDTSLLLLRSALFPTRATKAPGLASRVNSVTNFFASANECLCVMSYTTIEACIGLKGGLIVGSRLKAEGFSIVSFTVLS